MSPRTLLAAALAALPLSAPADESTTARNLAAGCAQCHGTNGHSVGGGFAALAGMPRERIVRRMKEFRDGSRPATVMHQIARGFTDRQVELIAGYFATQRKAP